MTEAWHDGDGTPVKFENILKYVEYYLANEGKIFIGTDSQLKSSSCLYVTTICLHGEGGSPPGLYFFKETSRNEESK